MKIFILLLESFVYPDEAVVFEKPALYEGSTDVLIKPVLVIEVSSPSTRKYDRHTKFSTIKRSLLLSKIY